MSMVDCVSSRFQRTATAAKWKRSGDATSLCFPVASCAGSSWRAATGAHTDATRVRQPNIGHMLSAFVTDAHIAGRRCTLECWHGSEGNISAARCLHRGLPAVRAVNAEDVRLRHTDGCGAMLSGRLSLWAVRPLARLRPPHMQKGGPVFCCPAADQLPLQSCGICMGIQPFKAAILLCPQDCHAGPCGGCPLSGPRACGCGKVRWCGSPLRQQPLLRCCT